MTAFGKWRRRRALRREQESLEFYAAIAGDKGRWGQRYRDHVAKHGDLSDVWGHRQMVEQMASAQATIQPATAQDGQSGTRTPPGKPGASEGDE